MIQLDVICRSSVATRQARRMVVMRSVTLRTPNPQSAIRNRYNAPCPRLSPAAPGTAVRRALTMARHPAAAVAAGIFASRLLGLLRVRAFSHFFGLQSDAADAFNAAFRIPNLLQNLFGEGALSGIVHPGLRGPARARRDGRGRADGAHGVRAAGAGRSRAVARRRARRVVGHRGAGAGLHRREARADDRARPHPVSRRGRAGALGVVPGRAQRPRPVLAELRGADRVERRDDRDAA